MKVDIILPKKVTNQTYGVIDKNHTVTISFEKYMKMVLEYNQKINLTNITDEEEFRKKHFEDCLEIVKYLKEGDNIIDVGTGAGFPGIVIAIYFEGKVNVTLLDSLNKRVDFLNEVIKELNLKNVTAIHGRAEELANDEKYREKYDVAVARAVAPLNTLLEYTSGYVKVNGKGVYMKGNNANIEIENARNAISKLNLKLNSVNPYSYVVKGETYNPNIVIVDKINNTPKNYPRNYGKIKKNPL